MPFRSAIHKASPDFVKSTGIESAAALFAFVRKWLAENDMMPTKDEVLKYVDEAFDTYIGPKFKRRFFRETANWVLLESVGELYDSLVG